MHAFGLQFTALVSLH